ncbi:MAG: hypothetical protein HUU29_00990 [Planctomycetaceae bacterium]|nr:hypothetical protein [Planctomycetaceae bacterium]
MSSESDDVAILANLAKLHRELKRLQAKERDHVQAYESAKTQVKRAREELAALGKAKEDDTLKSREIERELARVGQEFAKLNTASESARTQALLVAATREMETKKEQRNKLESDGLGILDHLDALNAQIQRAQAKLPELAAQEELSKQRLEQCRAEVGAARERVETERQRERERLAIETKVAYDGLVDDFGDDGLIIASDGVCNGCDTMISATIGALLKRLTKPIRCPNCRRFIYAAQ